MYSFIALLLLTPFCLYENIGVFLGGGSDLKVSKADHVKLKSEKVDFKFSTPNKIGKWGVEALSMVEVNATFKTENVSNTTQKLQLSFPLSFNEMRARDVVLPALNFAVISNGEKREALFTKGAKKYQNLYSWSENYNPKEEKTLNVSYGLYTSVMAPGIDIFTGNKRQVIPVFVFGFDYITETAKSWKGSIEDALFTADLTDWIQAMDAEPQSPVAELLKNDEEVIYEALSVDRPLMFLTFEKHGRRVEQNVIKWHFKNGLPVKSLFISITYAYVPITLETVKSFSQSLDTFALKSLFLS